MESVLGVGVGAVGIYKSNKTHFSTCLRKTVQFNIRF